MIKRKIIWKSLIAIFTVATISTNVFSTHKAAAATGLRITAPSSVEKDQVFDVAVKLSSDVLSDAFEICLTYNTAQLERSGEARFGTGISDLGPVVSGSITCDTPAKFAAFKAGGVSGSDITLIIVPFKMLASSGAVSVSFGTGSKVYSNGANLSITKTGASITATTPTTGGGGTGGGGTTPTGSTGTSTKPKAKQQAVIQPGPVTPEVQEIVEEAPDDSTEMVGPIEEEPVPEEKATNWGMLVGIGVGILVVAGSAYILVKRRGGGGGPAPDSDGLIITPSGSSTTMPTIPPEYTPPADPNQASNGYQNRYQ